MSIDSPAANVFQLTVKNVWTVASVVYAHEVNTVKDLINVAQNKHNWTSKHLR